MALKRKPRFFDYPMKANEVYFNKNTKAQLTFPEGHTAIGGQIFISGNILDELTNENTINSDPILNYFENEKPVFQRGDFAALHDMSLKGKVNGNYNFVIPYDIFNQLSFKRIALTDSLIVCLIYVFQGSTEIEEYNTNCALGNTQLNFPYYMLDNVLNIPANEELTIDVFSDNCYALIDNSAIIDGVKKEKFKWLRPSNDKSITILASQGDVLFAEFI